MAARRTSRARLWSVLVFALLVCTLLTAIHRRDSASDRSDEVTSLIRSHLLEQPSKLVVSAKRWWTNDIVALFRGPRLARENDQLKGQIAGLSEQNRELEDESIENRRLRALLDFKVRSALTLIPAEVLAVDPSAARDSITVSRGDRDGVTQRMAVLDPSGNLVGQVVVVDHDTCDALLLTDDLSSVGAVVVAQNRASIGAQPAGICRGERAPLLNLIDLPQNADIRPGDLVETSGLGSVYPPAIPIGVVSSVTVDGATMLKSAQVAPDADLDHLEDTLIVEAEPGKPQ